MRDVLIWMHKRLSPKQVAALGWTRIDNSRSKFGRWEHPSGWRIEHCGHPTALWPWALYSPTGEMVCTGAAYAPNPDPRNGTAWPNLASAMMFVAMTNEKEKEI